MKINCKLCEHTFGENKTLQSFNSFLVLSELFNDYDKYYHYLRHYKDRYKKKQVEKVQLNYEGEKNCLVKERMTRNISVKGLLTDGKSTKCSFCNEELFNFNNLGLRNLFSIYLNTFLLLF